MPKLLRLRLWCAVVAALALACVTVPAAARVELFVTDFEKHVHRFDGVIGADLGTLQATALLGTGSGIGAPGDGRLYVASWSTGSLLRYDLASGAFLGAAVTFTSDGPDGLCVGPDGLIYMARNLNGVHRFNPVTGEYLGLFAAKPQTGVPADCAFGPDGALYVVCASHPSGQVLRYNGATGELVGVFASEGMDFPTGMTFGPDGDLYVTGLIGNTVTRYDGSTGAYLGVFTTGKAPNGPEGIRFGPDGNLYVTSRGDHGVLRYDGATGAFIDQFATLPGCNPTKMQFVTVPEPSSLAALLLAAVGLRTPLRRRRHG